MLVLTRSELANLVNMDEVIEAIERAHAAMADGVGVDLGPASIAIPSTSSLLFPMAGAVEGAAGVKVLMDKPDNVGSQWPTQQSTIVLVNTATGGLEALLDGAAITRYRTAAASAVATRYLARENASVLGLVGAGALATTHLMAMRSVRPITKVVVWSRNPETSAKFAAKAAEMSVPIEVASTCEQVVSVADILCTLTPSQTPVVLGRWFRPGLHVNAVGAPPRSDYREIDTEGIKRSRVVVDSFQMVCKKSGDLLIPLSEAAISQSHFSDELGHVITGRAAGRVSEGEITLYKSVGLGIQDIAAARLVLAAARKRNVGTEIMLGS